MKRVYFIKPIGMRGPIKIGCSALPEKRIRQIDIWSPFALELIASAPGDHGDENALHWMFRDDLRHGEWFSPSDRLDAVVEHVRATGELPELARPPRRGYAKDRSRNPNRDPKAANAKRLLTHSVTVAERHAYSFWTDGKRPQRIQDLIDGYQGAFAPLPDASELAEIEEYTASLLAQPKDERTWREWFQWRHPMATAA